MPELAAINMKTLTIITILATSATHSYSQRDFHSISISERLSTEVRNYNQVEGYYIGCYGNKSMLYKKVDSLKKIVGQSTFENYFADSSLILRYYSFLTILKSNDTVAFQKLKSIISDTMKIDYEFAGQNRGRANFNSLLALEYINLIKSKYYYGGISVQEDGRVYIFPKRKIRVWKAKKSEFYKLIDQYKVNTRLIEY
jgi:hypothetical protein